MDQKIVLELDRKVADQQSTLEKAGVAGFYVTTNPQVSTVGLPWNSPGDAGSQRPNSLWRFITGPWGARPRVWRGKGGGKNYQGRSHCLCPCFPRPATHRAFICSSPAYTSVCTEPGQLQPCCRGGGVSLLFPLSGKPWAGFTGSQSHGFIA